MPRLKLLTRSRFAIAAGICLHTTAIAFSNLEILVKSYFDRFTAKASAAGKGGNPDSRIMVEHRLRLAEVLDAVTPSNLLSPTKKKAASF